MSMAGLDLWPDCGRCWGLAAKRAVDMRSFKAVPVASIAATLLLAVQAAAYETPAKGSDLRRALVDALRPHAEWMLGAPVEFVVNDLRVAGPLAFGAFAPQRPGGGAIALARTPMAARGEWEPDVMDGIHIEALYRKSGDTWVAVHWQIGATDVWYAWDPLCADYAAVIPEACP
jgi:hypothetical protein